MPRAFAAVELLARCPKNPISAASEKSVKAVTSTRRATTTVRDGFGISENRSAMHDGD